MQTRSGRILPAVSGFKMTIDQAGEVYAVSYCEGLKKYCRDMDIEFIFLNDFKLVFDYLQRRGPVDVIHKTNSIIPICTVTKPSTAPVYSISVDYNSKDPPEFNSVLTEYGGVQQKDKWDFDMENLVRLLNSKLCAYQILNATPELMLSLIDPKTTWTAIRQEAAYHEAQLAARREAARKRRESLFEGIHKSLGRIIDIMNS